MMDNKNGKLEIGLTKDKEDTDIPIRNQPVEPHMRVFSEEAVTAFKDLTDEERTQKRRALLKKHYVKMSQMALVRPEAPWEKQEKDAEANWHTTSQNLSLLGEVLRDSSGGAAALRHFHAAINHLQAY